MYLALLLLASQSLYSELCNAQLYNFGPGFGDSPGPDPGETTFFQTRKRFKVYNKKYKNVYICSNGFLALGRTQCQDNADSYADGHAVLAPFWIAQNTSADSASTAKIWYRTTRDQTILNQIAADLQGQFAGCKAADFVPREAVVVTWQDVRQMDECQSRGLSESRCDCLFNGPDYMPPERMPRYCDCIEQGQEPGYCMCLALGKENTGLCLTSPKQSHSNARRDVGDNVNTYQIVIASNKYKTFVFFQYDKISWISSKQFKMDDNSNEYPATYKAFVGFTGRKRDFYILPQSGSDELYDLVTTSNVAVNGRHVYEINSNEVLDPNCQALDAVEDADIDDVLYPFGPEHGDEPGPAVGEAHLAFDHPVTYYNTAYHNVYASSAGRVSFASEPPNVLSGPITPGINVFFARQDLRSSYQSDAVYLAYNSDGDPEAMLSSHFWYRVTSDPFLLARARSDLLIDGLDDDDFRPSELAVVTWYRSKTVDECARHGFTEQLCYCLFVTNIDTRCACLVATLVEMDQFYDYYYASEGDCDYSEVTNSDLFVAGGPYIKENTYQMVLASDPSRQITYVMLHYANVTWYRNHFYYNKFIDGPRYPNVEMAKVSIDNGVTDNTMYVHPNSESEQLLELPNLSNSGVPGRYIYRVSGDMVEMPYIPDRKCSRPVNSSGSAIA